MTLTLSMRRVGALLAAVLVFLIVSGAFAEYARYRLGSQSQIVDYFSLTEEQNVPSWWSSVMLLSCSVVLAAIAATKTRRAGEFKAHWTALAVIFLYLSLDELVEIHERLNDIDALAHFHGFLYYGWVVPAAVIVAVFAVSFVKFLFHLPPATRRKVALAGVLYVGGALGVELVLGTWTERHGELNLGWALIDLVEESMEIMGSSLFLYALLEYLGRSYPDLRLAIHGGDPGELPR